MITFEEERETDEWEVLTPDGWKAFLGVGKTPPLQVQELKTKKGKSLRCAANHRIKKPNGTTQFSSELFPGELIETDESGDSVESTKAHVHSEHMYDLLDVDGSIYFTNGIASHNSTTMGVLCLWMTLFNSNFKIAFLANKDDVAKEQLRRIKRMLEEIPMWAQQGVVEYNKHTIAFENGSSITVAATSSTAIRGFTFNMVILDEFAHVPFNVQQEFVTSVYPTITSGKTTRIAMTSTPCGMEAFHKTWQNAVKGDNEYKAYKVKWDDIPGRGEEFKRETIANIGLRAWRQEYACEFLGSDDTLIDPNTLINLVHKRPLDERGKHRIYEQPVDGHSYVALIDTAEGLNKDHSTIQMIDVTEFPYRQVAVFQDNTISPALFPSVIVSMCVKYNHARVLVETNGPGGQVTILMQQDEIGAGLLMYTALRKNMQVLSGGFGAGASHPGLRMTQSTKRLGCSGMKSIIETHRIIINDYETIQELSTFVEQTNGSFSAREGHNDDLVMGLVLLGWLCFQPTFKDETNTDFIDKMRKELTDAQEEEYFPFGMISSGSELASMNDGFLPSSFDMEDDDDDEINWGRDLL